MEQARKAYAPELGGGGVGGPYRGIVDSAGVLGMRLLALGGLLPLHGAGGPYRGSVESEEILVRGTGVKSCLCAVVALVARTGRSSTRRGS